MQERTNARSQRQLRVGESIRHDLVQIFQRGDFHDPELERFNISVTEVKISPDLKNATAYILPLGGDDADELLTILRKASAYFRSQLARTSTLKYVPRLSFEKDTSFDYADKIGTLMQSSKIQEDLHSKDDQEKDDE